MVISPMSFKFLRKLSYDEKLRFYSFIFNVDIENLPKYFSTVVMVIGLPFSSIVSREVVNGINTEYKLIFIIVLAIFSPLLFYRGGHKCDQSEH